MHRFFLNLKTCCSAVSRKLEYQPRQNRSRIWNDRLDAELGVFSGVCWSLSFWVGKEWNDQFQKNCGAVYMEMWNTRIWYQMSKEGSNFYHSNTSKQTSWALPLSERVKILPCLQTQLSGSVALKVLRSIEILLKADVLFRAEEIASNSEESLLITPAEMRKKKQQTKQESYLRRILDRGSKLEWENTFSRSLTPHTSAFKQTPYSLSALPEKNKS